MSKVILQGHIVVADSDLPAVLVHLPEHIELSRKEPGCLYFEIFQDPENDNVLNVYEEFQDRRAFEVHQARVKRSRWGELSANAKRHYQVSEH